MHYYSCLLWLYSSATGMLRDLWTGHLFLHVYLCYNSALPHSLLFECLHVYTCVCVCGWVWMGAFLTWLISQWKQMTFIFFFFLFFPLFSVVDFSLVDHLLIHVSWIVPRLIFFKPRLPETTWLQVERRMMTEESHWTSTMCTCSSKVSLFLDFYGCCDMWRVAVGIRSGRPSLKCVKEIVFQCILCYTDIVMCSMTL